MRQQVLDFSKEKKLKQFFDLTFTDVHMGHQKEPKSDFHSQFSQSKSVQIFLIFSSLKNISLGAGFFVIKIFKNLQFLNPFVF